MFLRLPFSIVTLLVVMSGSCERSEMTPQTTEIAIKGAITDEAKLNDRITVGPTLPGLQLVEPMVNCLGGKGYPLEREILYGGQVVNWVFTDLSDEKCQVKTGFRAFGSREQMKRTMTMISMGSVWHEESNIAMFLPWTHGSREDCTVGWSASFRAAIVSAFHECGRPEKGVPGAH